MNCNFQKDLPPVKLDCLTDFNILEPSEKEIQIFESKQIFLYRNSPQYIIDLVWEKLKNESYRFLY